MIARRRPGERVTRLASFSVAALLPVATLASPLVGLPTDPGTPVVGREVPVTPVDLSQEQAHNSPAIAVDPTEPRFVALASRVDGPAFGCTLHLSGDGGRSWQPAQPVPELPAGAERCYAPEVAFGPDGRLHYLFVGLQGEGNRPMGAFLTTSGDGGRTFSPPRQVLGPDTFMVRLAVDPTTAGEGASEGGRLHVVWLAPGAEPGLGGFASTLNPIMAMRSDDQGQSWSSPVQVSDPARARVVAPAVVIGPDGAVHVAYYDLRDDARDYQGLVGPTWDEEWTVVLSSSLDHGAGFARHTEVTSEVLPIERIMLIFTMAPPTLAADGAGGVFVAWPDARHGDGDALFARSGDAGRSFTAPIRLNDDAPGNGRRQYLPRLSVSPDGRLDAIFYDRRDDDKDVRNHVYATVSHDGGAHFAANVRLTSESSSSDTGPRYPIPSADGLVEIGSRLALVSSPERALAAWTDTRLSLPGSLQQDIFATDLAFPPDDAGAPGPGGTSSTGTPGPATVAVLSAGAVVALAAALALRRHRHRPRRSRPAVTAGEEPK